MTGSCDNGPSSLGGMLGETPYDHEEIEELRRRAWMEQGILIISPAAQGLSNRDRRLLVRIAEEAYGTDGR